MKVLIFPVGSLHDYSFSSLFKNIKSNFPNFKHLLSVILLLTFYYLKPFSFMLFGSRMHLKIIMICRI